MILHFPWDERAFAALLGPKPRPADVSGQSTTQGGTVRVRRELHLNCVYQKNRSPHSWTCGGGDWRAAWLYSLPKEETRGVPAPESLMSG